MSKPITDALGATLTTKGVRGRGMAPSLVSVEINDGDVASVYLLPSQATRLINELKDALRAVGMPVA